MSSPSHCNWTGDGGLEFQPAESAGGTQRFARHQEIDETGDPTGGWGGWGNRVVKMSDADKIGKINK